MANDSFLEYSKVESFLNIHWGQMGFVYKLFRDHNKKIHLGLPKLAGNNLAIEAENLPLLEGFLQDYESKG